MAVRRCGEGRMKGYLKGKEGRITRSLDMQANVSGSDQEIGKSHGRQRSRNLTMQE